MRDMMTVKIGAELLTVSAKDTATFFRLTRPKTTVANLEKEEHDKDENTHFAFEHKLQKHGQLWPL